MWGIVKFLLGVVIIVFLAQFIFGALSDMLGSNPNVRANWRTSVEMEQAVEYRPTPTSDFWDFLPRPVYRFFADSGARIAELYEEGKVAVTRSLPRRA